MIESAKLCVLCLPARSEADDVAAMMLAQVLAPLGCLVQAVSVTAQPAEMVDLVKQLKADVICISATAPSAIMHARSIHRQLRNRFPQANLIVGLWGARGDLIKAKERIGGGSETSIVGTLAEVQQQIGVALQPLLLNTAKQRRVDVERPVLAAHSDGPVNPRIDIEQLSKEAP